MAHDVALAHANHYDFRHVNVEGEGGADFIRSPATLLNAYAGNVVVTWGFRPQEDLPIVLGLRSSLGFRLVWFDGPRWAALKYFLARGTVDEAMFHLQMFNIIRTGLPDSIRPIKLNPFQVDGNFRTQRDIATELLGTP